jgi:cell division protein FtsW (lipid II flippase)
MERVPVSCQPGDRRCSVWIRKILLLGPVLVVALYRLRANAGRAMAAAVLVPGAAVLLHFHLHFDVILPAMAVFLFSLTGTLLFMIHRNVFGGSRRTLYVFAMAGSLCIIGLFSALPFQQTSFQKFTAPGNHASSVWDDSYNGILIQDLLSRAPLIGGISMTQSEMMDYGTDLVAVVILLYGWLPGILLLTVMAAFYALIFSCVLRTRGALASSVPFYCGLCLLFQSLLYVLGNFGYQHAAFTNLPLVSEGKLSIMANMLLLGFIFSAYRYDPVLDLPAFPAAFISVYTSKSSEWKLL